MPMHPAAPSDLHGLVEAFAQTAQAVVDLGRSCSEEDFARETECPGWTIKDQISHVAGVEAWLEGHRDPKVDVPPYEHVRNELGQKVESAVEVRRGRSGHDVLSELEHVLPQRLATLRSPGLTDSSIIPGPFGPERAATVALMRAFDVWAHEQDIRTALNRPGNLDSPAAAVFVNAALIQLPKLVARRAGLEPGSTVILDVTGPVVARAGVRVDTGDDGRPHGHAMFTGEHVDESVPHLEGPTVSISMSTDAFTRRAAGRRAVADTAYTVVGDEAMARRVLEALVVTH
ncbi:maleylpyruvate isomerase family mycothiol-dependent enzyme [Oryzihumus sp.]